MKSLENGSKLVIIYYKLVDVAKTMTKYDIAGEIEMEMKILTKQEAEANKVGRGRDEPNKDPLLDIPKNGRGFLNQLAFIKDLVNGVGSFYGTLMKLIKIGSVIAMIGIIVYIISILVKL